MGLDVLKDLPSYKPVLKAVLREQIQLLVEQLSEHTGEETVVLSANVTDGTLSYLGTESGKVFLEEEKLIKSKFLGFCLKRSAVMPSDFKQSEPGEQFSHSQSPAYSAKKMRVGSSADQWSPGSLPRSSQSLSGHPATPRSLGFENFLPGGSCTQRVTSHSLTDGSLRLNKESGQGFTEGEHRGQMANRRETFSQSQDNSGNAQHLADAHQQIINLINNDSTKQQTEDPSKQSMDNEELSKYYEMQYAKQLRVFKCSFCDKTFREKTNLRVHERVHTGEKPFTCRVCGKSFAHSSNVKQHERAVHKIAPSIPMYKQQFYSDTGAQFDNGQNSSSGDVNFDGSGNTYFSEGNNAYFTGSNAGQSIVKEEPQEECETIDLEQSNHGNGQNGNRFARQNQKTDGNNFHQTAVKTEPEMDSPVYDLDPPNFGP